MGVIMKRLIKILAAFAMILSNCTLIHAQESDKPLYLAIGDSVTYGYVLGGEPLTDECFANILAKDKGYSLQNESIVGNTADGILSQFDSDEFCSYVKNAQIITITCGGNDLMQIVYEKTRELYNSIYGKTADTALTSNLDVTKILSDSSDSRFQMVELAAFTAVQKMDKKNGYLADFKKSIEDFISNLNEVISKIKELNPDVEIYMATQYNPYQHFSGTYKSIGTHIENCAKMLQEAVVDNADGHYTIVDVYTAFSGKTAEYCTATEDPINLDFHPSVAGHAEIAKCFEKVVPEATTASIFGNGNIFIALGVGVLLMVVAFVIYRKKKVVA